MPTEVARTAYGVLTHYDEWNTLELKWLPATKDATEARCVAGGHAVRHPAKATRASGARGR